MSRENHAKLEAGLLRALNLMSTLDRISSDEVVVPPPPQRRHVPPPKMPDRPTMPNVPKARLTAEDEAKGRDLQARIQARRDQYMKEKLEYDAMERDLEDDLAEAEDKRKTLQKYFEKVNHEVAVARSGLDTVKDSQLIEIRNYTKPPDMVRKVLEVALVVLNEPQADDWQTMQHYIRQQDFIPSVRAVQDINNLEGDSLRRIKEITADPHFTTENARRASVACAPLVQWAHAMMHYYEVSINAQSLKEERDRLDAEISARQNELQNGSRRLNVLDKDIKQMQHEYDENYGPSAVSRLNDKARLEATTVYRAALADWRAKCNVLKEKHRAQIMEIENQHQRNSTPPKPPRPLLTRTVQTVEETRARCQRLVDAIQATMEQLKGPHGNVIVVEKRVYPKPVCRQVSSAAVRSFAEQHKKAEEEEKAAKNNKKRTRTPHTAPWRNGAKYTFEKDRRVPITVPEKEQPEDDASKNKHEDNNAAAAAAADSQQQQQYQQQPQYFDPNAQQQQQQQQQWGQPAAYDPYGQQQQQPQQQWGQQQQQQPVQQQQQYDSYGGGQQQQWGQPQPAAQQWGQPTSDPYGGGGGGGAPAGGGGFTFM